MAKFVRYNEVSLYRGSFYIFYYYWGKENRSLNRGLRYILSLYRGSTVVRPELLFSTLFYCSFVFWHSGCGPVVVS